jgi:integrase
MGLLWLFGCSTGYRVSDILRLRVSDVLGGQVSVRESKTGKERVIKLPKSVRSEIQRIRGLEEAYSNRLLFPSRNKACHSLTRQSVHKAIKSAGQTIGLNNLGAHSMRKTYAYNALKGSRSVSQVQGDLNHTYESTTLRYVSEGLIRHMPVPARLDLPVAEVLSVSSDGML